MTPRTDSEPARWNRQTVLLTTRLLRSPSRWGLSVASAMQRMARGRHDEGRGYPRLCMQNDVGHRPEVPVQAPATKATTTYEA